MSISVLEKNKAYSEKFVQPIKNPILSKEIRNLLKQEKINSVIDLGCGDGIFIHAIKNESPKIKITGVDISPRRIEGLKQKFPKDKFYIEDVCNTNIKEKFDFVHSSQVIEHVPNDKEMVKEMFRLLKQGGILFCSSVIKKPWAIYQYRNNNKFILDPTHEREYKNEKEFLDLFRRDFKLISHWKTKTKRRKFGLKFRIPGFYETYGIWRKR